MQTCNYFLWLQSQSRTDTRFESNSMLSVGQVSKKCALLGVVKAIRYDSILILFLNETLTKNKTGIFFWCSKKHTVISNVNIGEWIRHELVQSILNMTCSFLGVTRFMIEMFSWLNVTQMPEVIDAPVRHRLSWEVGSYCKVSKNGQAVLNTAML